MSAFDLTNQFLIAMPSMADPNFSRTVTYVCAHNEEGAMGIVINRPLNLSLSEVFTQMSIDNSAATSISQPIYEGGPVQRDRGFVIHQPANDWGSTIVVTPEVGVSTCKEILEAMSLGTGPADTLVALGYAGWSAGQLEHEMGQNAWLSGPASLEILFQTPAEQRWHFAASMMGVNLDALSSDVGHA